MQAKNPGCLLKQKTRVAIKAKNAAKFIHRTLMVSGNMINIHHSYGITSDTTDTGV
jgi:hypothetical protein